MSELLGSAGLQAGAGSLLALAVLLIFTGRLVTRRQLEDLRADCEARLRDAAAHNAETASERDTWRAAWQSESSARQLMQAQSSEQLELGRTAVHLLTALPLPSANGVTASAVVQPASPAS